MNSRSKYLIKNVGILTISNFALKKLVFVYVKAIVAIITRRNRIGSET